MASHRGSMSHIFRTLLYCIALTPVVSQYNQFTTSVAPGTTLWYPDGNGNGNSYTVRSDPPSGTVTITTSGTATTTTVINGRSIPTLVYNCEFMPFICKNIDNHIQNQGDWKFDSNGLMKLHVDVTGQGNNDVRRDGTCENKSRRNPSLYHQKGYPNNCKNIGSTTGISTLYSKFFSLPVSSVDKQPQIILGPPDPTDPTKNLFSGLVYTCDEFPSARYVAYLHNRTLTEADLRRTVGLKEDAASIMEVSGQRSSVLHNLHRAVPERQLSKQPLDKTPTLEKTLANRIGRLEPCPVSEPRLYEPIRSGLRQRARTKTPRILSSACFSCLRLSRLRR